MRERFTLLSELGRGGMGIVWRARDEETGTIVALKLLRETYAEDPDYVTRFERELELAKRIHSPNVVQVLGFGVRDGTPYLALEYVDGKSLREHLVAHGAYNWTETRPLLVQIAQGLADAHAAGVIHRDLKPSNVLIGSDGVAKIADFGIAKGLDLTRVTGTSTLLGTPAYLAPEGPNDERSDLYSLGVIAYEMLTGVVPFEGRTYQEVILRHVREAPNLAKLPPEARPIVGWLLAKEAGERPQRAAELLPVLWGGAGAPVAVVGVTGHSAGPALARPPEPPSQPVRTTHAPTSARTPSFAGAVDRDAGTAGSPNPTHLLPTGADRRRPSRRNANRAAGGLTVVLVALIAAGAFWMSQYGRPGGSDQGPATSSLIAESPGQSGSSGMPSARFMVTPLPVTPSPASSASPTQPAVVPSKKPQGAVPTLAPQPPAVTPSPSPQPPAASPSPVLGPPADPINVVTTSQGLTGQVAVHWQDNAGDVTGFYVGGAPGVGPSVVGPNAVTLWDTVGPNVRSDVTSVPAGSYFCFSVTAFNSFGQSNTVQGGCAQAH